MDTIIKISNILGITKRAEDHAEVLFLLEAITFSQDIEEKQRMEYRLNTLSQNISKSTKDSIDIYLTYKNQDKQQVLFDEKNLALNTIINNANKIEKKYQKLTDKKANSVENYVDYMLSNYYLNTLAYQAKSNKELEKLISKKIKEKINKQKNIKIKKELINLYQPYLNNYTFTNIQDQNNIGVKTDKFNESLKEIEIINTKIKLYDYSPKTPQDQAIQILLEKEKREVLKSTSRIYFYSKKQSDLWAKPIINLDKNNAKAFLEFINHELEINNDKEFLTSLYDIKINDFSTILELIDNFKKFNNIPNNLIEHHLIDFTNKNKDIENNKILMEKFYTEQNSINSFEKK